MSTEWNHVGEACFKLGSIGWERNLQLGSDNKGNQGRF
jgi:hypothetical protein